MSVLQHQSLLIEARLRVKNTAEGGRHNPIHVGYRAGWRVPQRDGRRTYSDGPVSLCGAEELAPGQAGMIQIFPIAPEFWRDLEIGSELEMCEGPRVVGVATVTGVFLSGSRNAQPEMRG